MSFPNSVKIVEVGPRDGLQNESKAIPTDIKVEFIDRLSETGLSVIEVTSFVSPKWIPQLGDHKKVFETIHKKSGVAYPVFVPNVKGFKNALEVGVKEVAVFTTSSETFCQRNVNCSVEQSLINIQEIIDEALKNNVRVRGYISCVLGCPYEGSTAPEAVAQIADRLVKLGCYEVSLGDTIGVGTPIKTKNLIQMVSSKVPIQQIAVHFHDTYGQALANIYVALEQGVSIIDSSVAGLGGCPYARGATGNVATEDVLYLLEGMNITTDVDLIKMIQVGRFITQFLDRAVQSKVNLAYQSKN